MMSSSPITSITPSLDRHYTSSQYFLPSDDVERARSADIDSAPLPASLIWNHYYRLDFQHRRFVKAFGNKLTLAPISLKEGDRVLESGVGTGTWMLEFAAQISENVNIEGIDIDSNNFPKTHPPNLHFSVGSITSLPESWSSSFKFVHQRLLIGALSVSMWKSAVSEIYRTLAPGGVVELIEARGYYTVGPSSGRVQSMIEKLFETMDLLTQIDIRIPAMLREAGFIDIHYEIARLPVNRSAGQEGLDGSETFAKYYLGLKGPILKAGGYGLVSSEEEYDALVADTKEEWLSCDEGLPFHIFHARKPSIDPRL